MERVKELIKLVGPGNFLAVIVLIILCAAFLWYIERQNEFTLSMTRLGYTNCSPGTVSAIWLKDCTEYYKMQNEKK